MIVNQKKISPPDLELSHLAFFLGRRMNDLVLESVHRAGFTGFRESHGYILQHFIDADRSMTELAGRMGVTQQAASKAVAELVQLGVLEQAPSEDRRTRRVRLSNYGWTLVTHTRKTRKRLEKKLLKCLGESGYLQAKKAILTGLESLGGINKIETRRLAAPR